MKLAVLLALAACGDDGGGGTIDLAYSVEGTPQPDLATTCDLRDTGEYWDLASGTNDRQVGIEVKWKDAAISEPGTYQTQGVTGVVSMFALYIETGMSQPTVSTAEGMVVFETYEPPAVAGTFDMAAGAAFEAHGRFDCH